MWRTRQEFKQALDAVRREQNRGGGLFIALGLIAFVLFAAAEAYLDARDAPQFSKNVVGFTWMGVMFACVAGMCWTLLRPAYKYCLRCSQCRKLLLFAHLSAVAIGCGRCGLCGANLIESGE